MIEKFVFEGFEEDELDLVKLVTASVTTTIFKNIGLPTLRSQCIHIVRDCSKEAPMYVSNCGYEKIIVNSKHAFYWQYAYQISHELGHLSTSSWKRHPRTDGHMWIEEALCECHSLIALQEMSKITGPLQVGAIDYCSILDEKHNDVEVAPEWFSQNKTALSQATSLTKEAFYMSRYIKKSVPADSILRDNRLINQLPVGLSFNEYLTEWQNLSGDEVSVPKALMMLALE
ncbi:hypothetical protein HBA91_05785 [Ochrobactrum sp. MR34]|nr:hypothetical protein [Ochrobactrum sp. MR34]